jgi:nucleoside-diphosphate-sugar epimerase
MSTDKSTSIDLKGKVVLVTGATGYIGSHLVRQLLREGAQVRALVRNPVKASALEKLGAEIHTADFSRPVSLPDVVNGCRVVFHAAGAVNEFRPYSYYRAVNVEGTRALAKAAAEARVERFIHTSSVVVYGAHAGKDVNESSPYRKSGFPYADTKLEGEKVVRRMVEERGLPAVIVQPSEVYGPEDPSWIIRPLGMINKGKMVLVSRGSGLIQPIYIDDVVRGILRAAGKGIIGQSYIICGSEAVTLREFFDYHRRILGKAQLPSVPAWLALTLATLAEWASRILRTPPIFTRQEARLTTMHAAFDGGKARRELGFEPQVTLPEGMRRVEEWWRSNPSK